MSNEVGQQDARNQDKDTPRGTVIDIWNGKVHLVMTKAAWTFLYVLSFLIAYVILTLSGEEIGIRWLFGEAGKRKVLGNSPDQNFLYILSLLMITSFVGVFLYFRGLPGKTSSVTDLSRSLTTFAIAMIGVLVLWGIFLFLIRTNVNGGLSRDDLIQIASLIIAPLSTIIGFVAGQSAGAGSQGALIHQVENANKRAIELAKQVPTPQQASPPSPPAERPSGEPDQE